MDDWTTAPLDHFLTRATYGFTNPMPTTDAGPYMVTARDINSGRILYETARRTSEDAYKSDITDKSRPDIGDVLVTKDGTLGRMAVVDRPNVCINQSVALLKPKETIRPRFLKYLLEEPRNFARMLGDADGTTIKHIYITRLAKMEVSVPSVDYQDRVLGVLASLDDKIELNRRMNETLEEMARALFRDWFVDFGPTRRQMEGATDPAAIMGHAFPPEKATTLAALFPAKLGEDGLPEGWSTIPFGEALADTIGGDWGKEAADEKHDVEVAIIRGTDFGALQEGTKGKVPQRFTTGKKAERRALSAGDILLEVSGGSPTQPTGRSLWVSQAMLDRFECDVVPASFCRRFRPKDTAWSLLLRQHLNDLYLRGGTWEYQNQSTGISNFQTTHFLEAEQVVHPSEAVLAAFHGIIDPLIQKTATNENQTLAEMRDLLLPKLMSGEIRLKDAEAVV